MTIYFRDITERKQLEAESQRHAAQSEIHRRLIEQREQERVQIARDLHDSPVQELTGVTLDLQGLILDCTDPATCEQLRSLQGRLKAMIVELRSYAQELRPPALTRFGLEQAMRSHLENFEEKHPELKVNFSAHQEGGLLSEPIRVAYYRIYQEALTNILKHAGASRVRIRLEKDDRQAILEIEDNGHGFQLPNDWLSLARNGHLGLVGMRERAEAIGGKFSVESVAGQGTKIQVQVQSE